MVACACKCQWRYEITSYCNKFLESEKLKQTFFSFYGGGAVCESRMLAWESKIEKGVVNRKTERQEKMRLFCLRILIPHTWEEYPGRSVSAGCSWVADKAAVHRVKARSRLTESLRALTYCTLRTGGFTSQRVHHKQLLLGGIIGSAPLFSSGGLAKRFLLVVCFNI